jgi:hypothetical protein
MRWLLHGVAFAAIGVLLAINVVGPSRLIADENVARVLNPALVPPDGKTGLDVAYVRQLGDDAVPALVRALPAVNGTDATELRAYLLRRRAELSGARTAGWPSWNLGREAAKEALRAVAP